MPDVAEKVIASGDADMVSMARPMLADAIFVIKAAAGPADEINTCIGCNQACLDHIFVRKISCCLVNPHACHETELVSSCPPGRRSASPWSARAPRVCRSPLSPLQRGHNVTLFDADIEIGGQFNIARKVPGKEEFNETLRYFATP
ncbi:MAG: hypothetical protein QM749_05750 [Aquabacterium sp.]